MPTAEEQPFRPMPMTPIDWDVDAAMQAKTLHPSQAGATGGSAKASQSRSPSKKKGRGKQKGKKFFNKQKEKRPRPKIIDLDKYPVKIPASAPPAAHEGEQKGGKKGQGKKKGSGKKGRGKQANAELKFTIPGKDAKGAGRGKNK